MNSFLIIFQIFISVLIVALVFLQASGDSESRTNIMTSVNFEKRGWEKVMYYFTIGSIFVFLLSSIVQTLI
ncbi:MAG: preprotein translocase subunit SecG [Candidatus Shapirobacteria bacterium]|jgi:protein translocase SecG subunit